MSAPVRVLELRSVWGTGGGPEKTILLGARPLAGSSTRVTVCYIRDARDRVFSIDRRARELGVDYAEIVERHSLDPGVWPMLRKLVQRRGITIIHSHDYKTNLLAWALSAFEPIVPLATAHGWVSRIPRQRVYYAFEKRLLRRFPRVIAVSADIKTELVRTGSRAERVTVIPNGIECGAFLRKPSEHESARHDLGFTPDDLVIGAVGRLEDEKRFDLLMDAVARLRAQWPQLRLAIIGDGACRLALERTRNQLSLESTCHLLGHRSDVAHLHNAFDVFVQSSDREGTPNSVLEAMALETPIVATNVGGTSGIVDDGIHGLLVRAGDAKALASAIERVLLDREAAQVRAQAARRRVETELSFEARMARLDLIYQELAARGRRQAVTRHLATGH
jgi:glycosyltransferase involved in cell wall biosynthesis